MKVLVCGGRDYTDKEQVFLCLDKIKQILGDDLRICHGGARGADSLAGEWAQSRNVSCTVFPADWASHGRSAGPLRNLQMLVTFQPDYILDFPGGKGTRDMLKKASHAKITRFEFPGINMDIDYFYIGTIMTVRLP